MADGVETNIEVISAFSSSFSFTVESTKVEFLFK